MRLLDRSDQLAWEQWVAEAGWSPGKPEPSPLPPGVAVVAANALKALVESMQADLQDVRLSEDAALNCLNDIDRAKAGIASLQDDISQRDTISAYEIN